MPEITLNVSNGVAVVVLNRPENLNAVTTSMCESLIEAFDTTDADESVRAVIVTGAGRAFCAGADLSSGGGSFERTSDPESGAPRDIGGCVNLRIYRSIKPVIAAVNGPAVGFGASMILPMDFRLAVDSAKIGYPFTARGIIPDGSSSWFLPRVVGIGKATEWTLTGRYVPPAELLSAGYANLLAAPDEVLATAQGIAREIAENVSPVSAALTRRLLWGMLGTEHPMTAHVAESRGLYERTRGADAAEGVAAFLEKRAPRFPLTVSKHLPDIFDPAHPAPAYPDERVSPRYAPTPDPGGTP